MKHHMKLECQTIVVLCCVALTFADQKFWSRSLNSDDSVINVTSDAIVIKPKYATYPTYLRYSSDPVVARTSRVSQDFKPYAFRPRAIPLKKTDPPQQEQNVYYTHDNKYKTEILFPGNYFAIPKEKSIDDARATYSPASDIAFEPKAIPLLRSQGFERRSLNVDIEPDEERSDEVPEQEASRRSLSYILGAEEDEDNEDEEGEFEEEDDGTLEQKGSHIKHKIKKKIKSAKKYSKYMMPLLLAYKLKYFALIPVMIGGLVLLVGATGLAGFFFALFAAVMGLQKGGY